MAPVVVVGGHQKATGGDGGHALACGMVESSVVTPQRPWHASQVAGKEASGLEAQLQGDLWEATL